MSSNSGGNAENNITIASDDEMGDCSGKRKYDEADLLENLQSLTQDQIQEIIGIVKKHNTDNSQQKTPEPQQEQDSFTLVSYQPRKTANQQNQINYTEQHNSGTTQIPHNKHKNISTRMRELQNKTYNNLFYINTPSQLDSRTQMADLWESMRPSNNDVILKTKKGFLLKTDSPKVIVTNTLKNLQSHNKITNFSPTMPYTHSSQPPKIPQQTYSCVIASVELDITDTQVTQHLQNSNVELRYCKRIISKKSSQPTHFVRIITGNCKSYENLLNEGMFYKNRHYAIYPSAPPPPAPLPCGKCLQYTHKTEDCTTPIKCLKCSKDHTTNKCQSNLPPKCTSCGSEEHQAWSFQCPNRPLKPIEGIPNLPIKTLNKKSREVTEDTKNNSRIHAPVTIHDIIINTYIEKLNKPKNSNREELLLKLRKKFIQEYNIETSVSFVGNNWTYILMFDLDNNDYVSPTEIISGKNNGQVCVQT